MLPIQIWNVFPKRRLFHRNPIRKGLRVSEKRKRRINFRLERETRHLVIGGSLGALSINNGIRTKLDLTRSSGVQFLWQTGKIYYQDMKAELDNHPTGNLHLLEFIQRMDLAFAAADLVISRAGAGTISELCVLGMPSILVPSPNVAEDHQTANARALADRGAALLITDAEVGEKLVEKALKLVNDEQRLSEFSVKMREMGTPNATKDIVDVILSLIKNG